MLLPTKIMKITGVAAALIITAVTFGAGVLSQQQKAMKRYGIWRVDGPRCATVPAPSSTTIYKAIEVEDARFSRETGHVTCITLNDKEGRGFGTFPACQFTSPSSIKVEYRGKVVVFDPGPGRPATVFARKDRIDCVIGMNPDTFSDANDYP